MNGSDIITSSSTCMSKEYLKVYQSKNVKKYT